MAVSLLTKLKSNAGGRSTSGTLLFLAYLKSPGSPRLFYLAATMGTLPASYSARGLTFAVQILPAIFYTKWGDNPKHTQKRIHLKPHIHK
jgi:hypothetical protein